MSYNHKIFLAAENTFFFSFPNLCSQLRCCLRQARTHRCKYCASKQQLTSIFQVLLMNSFLAWLPEVHVVEVPARKTGRPLTLQLENIMFYIDIWELETLTAEKLLHLLKK